MDKRILIISADNLGIGIDQVPYQHFEYLKYPVLIGEEEYRESETYSAKWLLERFIKEKIAAKSSSLSRAEMTNLIEKNVNNYDLIIQVVMGSNMSAATFNIAEEVKEKFRERIPVINIDSRQVTGGIGAVLLRLIDIIKTTDDVEGIKKQAEELVVNTFSYYVTPDLNYLYRGGRIGKAKALLGSVLRMLPVIGLMGDDPEGVVVPVGQGRTYKQVNSLIINSIREKMNEKKADKITISIISGDESNSEAINGLRQELVSSVPVEKLVTGKLHLVEAIYMGPGGYGITVCMK
ncbi:MAG TPA: DegV family protein [Bacteroidales bacterium]|jgi:DegV family protein with EDD domain|nr:DegV family protein [Bacteroidales bacterium]HQG37445.1 DegV family protein [Bacteroidales bacterium]HQJ21697.1 DegV family protein [Bacteroidales bacterium]